MEKEREDSELSEIEKLFGNFDNKPENKRSTIKCVKNTSGVVNSILRDMGLEETDLVEITIEKVEGSPTEWIKNKYLQSRR